MNHRTSRLGRGSAVVWLALAFGAGCNDGTVPVTATAAEDAARTTLDKVLGAWQNGEAMAAMKQASPAITVVDPTWESGRKLTSFEVLGGGEPSGAERVFQVKLWLVDESGKKTVENVAYRVGTQPILTVFRSLF